MNTGPGDPDHTAGIQEAEAAFYKFNASLGYTAIPYFKNRKQTKQNTPPNRTENIYS